MPDLDGLRRFIGEGDRKRARFFVGRQAQIDRIAEACNLALGGDPAGATFVIQGAPGAGKTALLSRIRELWTGPGDPHVVLCPLNTIASPALLAGAVIDAAAPRLARKFRNGPSVEAGGRFSLFGVITLSGRRSPGRSSPADDPWTWLRRRRPPEKWKRPVCLMADEIQVLRKDRADGLLDLHKGSFGLPIVPVLAGLTHSRKVLAECGIPRLSDDAVLTLGALEAGEPSQAVRRMLAHFRIDVSGADPDRWAGQIEEWSDRWPQHLQNGMRSLAEGLIAVDGALARVDEEAVAMRAQERRTNAYAARLSDEMRDARLLVAAVMTEIDDRGWPQGKVASIVENIARSSGPFEWRLPEAMNARAFVHHLIARGALQLNDEDLLACPIPSFRRFLIARGAAEAAASDMNRPSA